MIDELVKSHFAAWIPAFAGMTAFISIQSSIDNIQLRQNILTEFQKAVILIWEII
jgi:hypothetical protein